MSRSGRRQSPQSKARKKARATDIDIFAGRRLRDARREAGFTQEELAATLGISFQAVQKYESGENRLSIGRLLAAATALGRPITDFLPIDALLGDEIGDNKAMTAPTPWAAIRLPLESLSRPQLASFRPLVKMWEASRGRLPEDFDRQVAAAGYQARTILLRQLPKSKRLILERVPFGSLLMRPEQWLTLLGRDLEDLPDPKYAAWAHRAYNEILADGGPRLDNVRAITLTFDRATLNVRYDRLVMPWRAAGLDRLISVFTIRREVSILP